MCTEIEVTTDEGVQRIETLGQLRALLGGEPEWERNPYSDQPPCPPDEVCLCLVDTESTARKHCYSYSHDGLTDYFSRLAVRKSEKPA